jgi:hypothetical protein
MNEATRLLMEEQKSVKSLVNSWMTKQQDMEELNSVEKWHQRKTLLIFGIEEFPH